MTMSLSFLICLGVIWYARNNCNLYAAVIWVDSDVRKVAFLESVLESGPAVPNRT